MSDKATGKKGLFFLLLILSWLIVGFGQPAWVSWCGPIASVVGFALFWKGMLILEGVKKRFWLAAGWFTAVQLVQLSWLTADDYHGLYIWIIYALFALCLGLQFGLVSLIVKGGSQLTLSRILGVASGWTLIEWLRVQVMGGCGGAWDPVGLLLTGYTLPLQFAAVAGIYGLTFWVILTNLFALKLLTTPFKKQRALVFAGVVIVPYLFGIITLNFLDKKDDKTINAVLVQTAIAPDEKEALIRGPGAALHPVDQWAQILKFLRPYQGKKIDFIVCPESTVPFYPNTLICSYKATQEIVGAILGKEAVKDLPPLEAPFAEQIEREGETFWAVSNSYWTQIVANHFQSGVIVGLQDEERGVDGEVRGYNAAFYYRPQQNTTERYEKRVLLPIAECFPFEWCKSIGKKYGIFAAFTPGTIAKVFQGKVPFGISICQEEIFSELMRENRVKGAELLINITNDAWYPYSQLPEQQFYHGRVRAVENGIPLLRACNTGVTVGIDAFGRSVAKFGENARASEWVAGALFVSVPSRTHWTLYSIAGDNLIVALSVVCLLLFVRAERRGKRKNDE